MRNNFIAELVVTYINAKNIEESVKNQSEKSGINENITDKGKDHMNKGNQEQLTMLDMVERHAGITGTALQQREVSVGQINRKEGQPKPGGRCWQEARLLEYQI